MTMLYWLFAIYGWMLAIIFGVAYVYCYRSYQRSLLRETRYLAMIADHVPEIQPSLTALKAARVTVPLVLLLLCLPSISSAQSTPRAPLWVMVAGHAADLASTEYVMHSGCCREVNPIMGASTTQRVIVKSLGTVASAYLVHAIGRRHPRLAKVLGYGIGAAMTGVAVRNLQQVTR